MRVIESCRLHPPVISAVSVDALEGVFEYESGDNHSGRLTIIDGRAEVNAAVNAGVVNLSKGRGKVGKGTDYAEHHVGVHSEGAVFAEESGSAGNPAAATLRTMAG
jgi:hypothetical protein